MSSIAVVPAALIAKDKWDDFVIFLKAVPVPLRRKKEVLVEWTKTVGVALTEDMVKEVFGPLVDKVR